MSERLEELWLVRVVNRWLKNEVTMWDLGRLQSITAVKFESIWSEKLKCSCSDKAERGVEYFIKLLLLSEMNRHSVREE